MNILIIGGSFGGLNVAYDLRRLLPHKSHKITVISKDPRFIFIPSLPWVAMGSKTMDSISFALDGPLKAKDIDFIGAAVVGIDPAACQVRTDKKTLDYDYLVVTTGHRSANEAVPGLGPFDGPGHSLMSASETEEARDTWAAFLESPGPMVIGAAPGASCLGPAYEFLFEAHHALKQRKLCHKAPMTFITPEPYLGHFGVGGFGKIRQFLEGELEDRDVRYRTSTAISNIASDSVETADGATYESSYSLIIPPLAGVKAVAASPGLANPKGFIPVDAYYRHNDFNNIYAAGVAVALPPVEETPVPVNFPKTGHMTEQMARIVAKNIAADILSTEKTTHELMAECIMDMGDEGAHIVADPVRPPRNVSRLSSGKRWLWAKRFFANYYLWKLRRGANRSPRWVW